MIELNNSLPGLGYCTFLFFKNHHKLLTRRLRLVEYEVKDNYWILEFLMKECMLHQMPLNPAFISEDSFYLGIRHGNNWFFFFFLLCVLYLLFKEKPLPKMRRTKQTKCVLVTCPPRSGEPNNRKCLFASIFLNVNCERETGGHCGSLNLTHSLTVA